MPGIEDERLLTGENGPSDEWYDAQYNAMLEAADFYYDCMED